MYFPTLTFLKKCVQFSSVAQLCPTLCDPMNRSTPGLPVHHQLPEFTQIHVHQVGDAIQPSHPLSSPSPPAPPIPPSIRVFSNESTLRMRWPKYWSFSFSMSPSNEYSGLIFFRMDWLDILAVQGLSRIFSRVRVSSNEWALPIRGPKDGSFSFSMSPSNEYSGLISFRMDGLISLQFNKEVGSSTWGTLNSGCLGSCVLSKHGKDVVHQWGAGLRPEMG